MSDLNLTNWYLDKLKEDVGGEENLSPSGKIFGRLTALPFRAADALVNTIKDFPSEIVGLLKETMYVNPDAAPEEYAGKMFSLASSVAGTGMGASLLSSEEAALLGMNKADALKMWAKSVYNEAQGLEGKDKIKFLEKAQNIYTHLENRLSENDFDPIDKLSVAKLETGTKGAYTPVTPSNSATGIMVDLNQAKDSLDAINTVFHEFAHSKQYNPNFVSTLEEELNTQLFHYRNEAGKKAMSIVEKAEEATQDKSYKLGVSYSALKDQIYRKHDPTEAMARYIGQEMSENPEVALKDVYNSYLDKFLEEHRDYSAKPRSSKGFDLGPNWEEFFRKTYLDRTAQYALDKIEDL